MRKFLLAAICLTALQMAAAEEATLVTPTGTLRGLFILPNASSPPVALIIAGSGPTDRDGNSPALPGPNNSLKLLAEGLADEGVATLRYDKRGVGASAAAARTESDLRFETYVDDAAMWVAKLRADKRFSRVMIVGHSEGSLIGILAAQRGGVDRLVSIAGPGRGAAETIRGQLATRLPADLLKASNSILESLSAGKTVADVPPALAALYRPSVQPYLISWFRYDPVREVGKLKIPVLIVQGDTDMRVSVDDARLLAGKDRGLLIIDGMNHVLKHVPANEAQQVKSYGDPSLPVEPALVRAIAKFAK
jgi:pimeloyl-ACP methyl ester carboxylesterase